MKKIINNKIQTSHEIKQFIIPGDKSISHRALIFGAISGIPVEIKNLNSGKDVENTKNALMSIGVNITQKHNNITYIKKEGPFKKPNSDIYLGNSGTSARLLIGLFSSLDFESVITGDESLSRRPMNRVIDPLVKIGCNFIGSKLPLKILASKIKDPFGLNIEVPSAQVKSALIISALFRNGISRIIEIKKTRPHTEDLLKLWGFPINLIDFEHDKIKYTLIEIKGPFVKINDKEEIFYEIPCDPSAAAFGIVYGLISSNPVTVKRVCSSEHRLDFLNVLKEMGGNIEINNTNNDLIDITSYPSKLHGIEVSSNRSIMLIDEYPILSIAAAFAEGFTVFKGLKELRLKESNRIQKIEEHLKLFGVDAFVNGDDLHIKGGINKISSDYVEINPEHDHRIAMSFSILSIVSGIKSILNNPETISTSFKDFWNFFEH